MQGGHAAVDVRIGLDGEPVQRGQERDEARFCDAGPWLQELFDQAQTLAGRRGERVDLFAGLAVKPAFQQTRLAPVLAEALGRAVGEIEMGAEGVQLRIQEVVQLMGGHGGVRRAEVGLEDPGNQRQRVHAQHAEGCVVLDEPPDLERHRERSHEVSLSEDVDTVSAI